MGIQVDGRATKRLPRMLVAACVMLRSFLLLQACRLSRYVRPMPAGSVYSRRAQSQLKTPDQNGAQPSGKYLQSQRTIRKDSRTESALTVANSRTHSALLASNLASPLACLLRAHEPVVSRKLLSEFGKTPRIAIRHFRIKSRLPQFFILGGSSCD